MMGAGTLIYDTASRESALAAIDGLYDTITSILQTSDELDRPASDVADEMAVARIKAATEVTPRLGAIGG